MEAPLIPPVFIGAESATETLPVVTTTWIISNRGRFVYPLRAYNVSSAVFGGKKRIFGIKQNSFFLFLILFQISWTSDHFCVWRSGLFLSLVFGSEEDGVYRAKAIGKDEESRRK